MEKTLRAFPKLILKIKNSRIKAYTFGTTYMHTIDLQLVNADKIKSSLSEFRSHFLRAVSHAIHLKAEQMKCA